MLTIPYSTELRLGQRPYVTYAIMVLCLVVFYAQLKSSDDVENAISNYCQSISTPKSDSVKYDYMPRSKDSCVFYLKMMHDYPNIDNWIEYNLAVYGEQYKKEVLEQYAVFELKHYNDFLMQDVPRSLDSWLMYDPYSLNPFKMLTSALSHASWSHIIFNLIFFFAFAPALEILSGNKWKFIGVLITIEFIGGVIYSIISITNNSPIPTLGLSGSVMGMIGLSAYLMPKARIRTFVWFIYFARTLSIPAWLLATWYIGWDAYDLFSRTDNGGVNILAHVSGGLSGYLLGWWFFKNEKILAKEELADEIDYIRAKREDTFSLANTFKGNRRYVDSKQREYDAKKEYGRYKDELYHLVHSGKTSEAIVLMIKNYDLYSQSPEIYEELFNEVGEWKKKRVYFCLGRLIIDLLIEHKKYRRVFEVLQSCIDADEQFVVGDPDLLVFIVKEAVNQHRYELAYNLLKNSKDKYGKYINYCDCILLEARILWEYLDRGMDSKELLLNAIDNANGYEKQEFNKLLLLMT